VDGLRHVIALAPKVGKTPREIVGAIVRASGTDPATALREIGGRLPGHKTIKPMAEEELKTKERLGTFKEGMAAAKSA
jgi:hypothetical protein